MFACEACPAIDRFNCEYTEARIASVYEPDGRLSRASFERIIEPILGKSGIETMSEMIPCSSIPQLGDCMHEDFVRKKTIELMPQALVELKTNMTFVKMTRDLNGFEGI